MGNHEKVLRTLALRLSIACICLTLLVDYNPQSRGLLELRAVPGLSCILQYLLGAELSVFGGMNSVCSQCEQRYSMNTGSIDQRTKGNESGLTPRVCRVCDFPGRLTGEERLAVVPLTYPS